VAQKVSEKRKILYIYSKKVVFLFPWHALFVCGGATSPNNDKTEDVPINTRTCVTLSLSSSGDRAPPSIRGSEGWSPAPTAHVYVSSGETLYPQIAPVAVLTVRACVCVNVCVWMLVTAGSHCHQSMIFIILRCVKLENTLFIFCFPRCS